jgi:hypothetical protein
VKFGIDYKNGSKKVWITRIEGSPTDSGYRFAEWVDKVNRETDALFTIMQDGIFYTSEKEYFVIAKAKYHDITPTIPDIGDTMREMHMDFEHAKDYIWELCLDKYRYHGGDVWWKEPK